MERVAVTSSDIREVGYEALGQLLEITFHSGGVYQYGGVPESVYRALLTAPSHGRYFHAYIKDTYPYQRVG